MGKSNPSASKGYAGASNSRITARPTFGGNSKAGLGSSIGSFGQFVVRDIATRAPTIAGPNYPAAFILGRVKGPYPISFTNQIGGVGTSRWGMFGSSADGVNYITRRAQQNYVNHWNILWPSLPA